MPHRTVFALLLSCVVSMAHGHALLDHAEPRVGSVVAGAPTQLSLWFTQDVEPALSKVEVRDSAGHRVDQGRPEMDAADSTLLRVALKPLSPGSYEVHWQVLSADTHPTEGHFHFDVAN